MQRAHPKDCRLILLDTPGLFDTIDNSQVILNEIIQHAEGKHIDCIMFCRRFTHPQTHDYTVLKQLAYNLSKRWNKTPIVMVYTRSADRPDANIVRRLALDVEKYSLPSYNYYRKARKYAAFRNARIVQAKMDGFDACFFFENQGEDEEWQHPDGSNILNPIVNFLCHLSPDIVPDLLNYSIKYSYNNETN